MRCVCANVGCYHAGGKEACESIETLHDYTCL